jgi:3,4-dihydroxy 2-butanone 4-phosphate synthase/GTP cyclohydrolase II
VTDDDDRSEGDLIVAATLCTAEKMAFIIRHFGHRLCTDHGGQARRLRLDPMVAHNDSITPAVTVSIDLQARFDHRHFGRRARLLKALANPNAGASDFARQSHLSADRA